MSHLDPLQDWFLTEPEENIPPSRIALIQADLHAGLEELTRFLDETPTSSADARRVARRLFWGRHGFVGFTSQDLPGAEQAYLRLLQRGGYGNVEIQALLLNLIAASEDPASVPFWRRLLDIQLPRDLFASQRRILALAALARIAIRQDAPVAYTALRQAIAHDNGEVRGLAIHYLGRAYLDAQRPLPAELISALALIAVKDALFEPRFQARALLRAASQTVPLDNAGGVYTFKLSPILMRRVWRHIAVRSEQTLLELHHAIQYAFGWDDKHLHTFYLNGRKYDDRFAFASPHEGERAPATHTAVIGELGLVKDHSFLYHYDYVNDYLLDVDVIDIQPEAPSGDYPRVVDSYGKSPFQIR